MSSSFLELGSADSSEAAAQKVAQHIEYAADTADIFDKLTQNGTTPVSGLGEKFYVKGDPEFLCTRKIPIPGELQMQMNNVHSQFSMGFFTEISRVWVVIDNNLYMWNYDTNDDLAFFDNSDTTIMKVALTKMKAGVFEAGVQYGLVVGTISEILLYPVFEVEEGGRSSIIVDSNRRFRVSLDGAVINDIVHTANGRIFYSANDRLFEFYYEKQDGWFGTSHKCKAINQTATILGTLIPALFFGNTKEGLDQITVDRSRNILYCLGKMGTIIVFDLGADGEGCTKVCSVPSSKIAHEANLLTQYGHDESTFKNIVSIRAIESNQSSQINLVATTVKGVRMYLSVLTRNVNSNVNIIGGSKNVIQSEVRPQCLRVAHVRFAPGVTPTSIYGDGPNGVSFAYVNETFCAMATANSHSIYVFSNFFYPTARTFIESATDCEVSGHVWEIETVTHQRIQKRPPLPGVVENVRPHSFYRSQLEDNAKLLVCSNEGVFEYTHLNAVDALRDALFDGGVEGKATLKLWQKLGSTEMLVLALRILASNVPLDERIKNKAEQILYSLKEAPEIVENDQMESESVWSPNESSIADWKNKMKSPLLSSTPRTTDFGHKTAYNSPFSPMLSTSMTSGAKNMRMSPSRRHDALFYYFSRLVAPMWNDTICEVFNGKHLRITFNPTHLILMKDEVSTLGKLMDDYRLVPSVDFQSHVTNPTDILNAEAYSLERQSLMGLRKLVEATVETLSLWILAFEYNLEAISFGMNPAILPNFAGRKLCQLVADGSNLNAELIRAMIKYFLGDEAGTKQLSENLRSMCPNLYSEDDACVTHGMEQLEAAKKLGAGASRRRLVTAAVDMFKQSIGKVVLSSTCQQLAETVGAYEEVVELCLMRANKDDPKQLALLAYKHGRNGADTEMRVAEKRRADCYKVITDELDRLEEEASTLHGAHSDAALNRDLMITAVMNSEDQLAHAAIFRWLLSKNKTNVILQSKSPYIEFFLIQEINTGRGQKYFDLLWRFYEKSGSYEKAAKLLSKLAENENYEISLSQRCAYLSHAIMCAQSCKDTAVTENIEELRDRLEVANIQLSIKEALDCPSTRNKEIVKLLDGPIMSLQDLLVRYVLPFKLHKIQLSIYYCANMYVEERIFETWENIIQEEFATSQNESSLCENLMRTIGDLNAIYRETNYFPKDFIIRRVLEIGSGGITASQRIVLPTSFYPPFCKHIEITHLEFLKIASDEFRSGGDAWWTQNERGQEYITQVVKRMAKAVIQDLESNPLTKNKKSVANECITHILPFIRRACDVSSSQQIQTIGAELTAIQHRLTAFSS
ncbi:unnamed protein product [Caenorhabditis bovis]|uniref:Nucleoporin Nup133/Nup155-like N-terminal domain-containing protein n=1 Tax=Caenorhabditis bovis TaxID=2654633 RepID=A0A8S1EWN4_9PELO|nr:unnamed protein product [Caenorhabditis bovis]